MRLLTALFAVCLLSCTGAVAQDTCSDLRLNPEQERALYQTLRKQRVKVRSAKLDARVGSQVPRSVSLYGVPMDAPIVSVRGCRYTLAGDRVILVEARTRTIVLILGVGF
jgi:Protein of unknown function (DUF1236)